MKIVTKRRVIRLGSSNAVTLPSIFLKINDIKPGDVVQLEGSEKLLKIKKLNKKAGSQPAK